MGEICNAMLEGRICSLCGQYFVKEHGYPVLCGECWCEDATEAEAIHPLEELSEG